MTTDSWAHLSFAQLLIEARMVFCFQSFSAWEYHCDWPHTSAEVLDDLDRTWNAEGLTLRDLQDWERMSELLEKSRRAHQSGASGFRMLVTEEGR